MSESIILELRQADSEILPRKNNGEVQNGDYEVVLDNPVMLEEGDQVQVKSVYLDTALSGSGTIHIQEPIDAVIECAMYLNNYNIDQQYEYQGPVPAEPAYPPGPAPLKTYTGLGLGDDFNDTFLGDNSLWWLAERSDPTGIIWDIDGINVYPIINSKGYAYFGGVVLHFEYTPTTPGAIPFSGKAQIHVKEHLRYNYQEFNPYYLKVQCTGTADQPDFRYAYGITNHSKIDRVEINKKTITTGTEKKYNLQTFDMPITIPAGDYLPSELTQLLNDVISDAQFNGKASDEVYGVGMNDIPVSTNDEWQIQNPVLTTALKNHQFLYNKGQAQTPPVAIDQVFVNASMSNYTMPDGTVIKPAGTTYFNFPIDKMKKESYNAPTAPDRRPPLDRYIGTNQFSFQLDQEEQKIKIDLMHFPIYGNSSSSGTGTDYERVNDAVPVVAYNGSFNDPALPAQPNFVVDNGLATQYSGIAITSMTPTSFWFDTLGFNEAIVQPSYDAKCKSIPTDPVPDSFNSFTMDVVDGVNITGAYPGLDVGVQHHEDFYMQPIWNNFAGNDADTIVSTSDSTSIFASRVYNQVIADEGYFKINIKNNFQQKMVGSSLTSRDTQSIVNRYYTANSFTSDQGAGSVIYTHRGAPQLLSSFSIQVLNPDNTLVDPTILAEKNTVFIEILKPLQQSNPTKQ